MRRAGSVMRSDNGDKILRWVPHNGLYPWSPHSSRGSSWCCCWRCRAQRRRASLPRPVPRVAAVDASASGTPVAYRLSFPQPEHRWMQVEATFSDVPAGVLQLRMSRSSPGRYALHEFAKNVYNVRVTDVAGSAADGGAAEPAPVGRHRAPGKRARHLRHLRRPRRRHLPGHRQHARAHQHACRADVGAWPRAAQRHGPLRASRGRVVARRHATVPGPGCRSPSPPRICST